MTDAGAVPNPDPPVGLATASDPVHVFPVRVYYEDTDAGGIVYYANYLKFAERARTELLRRTGRQQFDLLRERGIGFTVRSCRAEYLAPARLDDILEVRSAVTEVLGASMRMSQGIWRGGRLLCDLRLRIAVMNRDGRPTRIPIEIRRALQLCIVPSPSSDEEAADPGCGGAPPQPGSAASSSLEGDGTIQSCNALRISIGMRVGRPSRFMTAIRRRRSHSSRPPRQIPWLMRMLAPSTSVTALRTSRMSSSRAGARYSARHERTVKPIPRSRSRSNCCRPVRRSSSVRARSANLR